MPKEQEAWNTLVARAMACGVNKRIYYRTREGVKVIEAGVPLSLRQAARVLGCRIARMEQAAQSPEFRKTLEDEMRAADLLTEPESFAAALAIRDDRTAEPRARLTAIETIRHVPTRP
jgi:hypothetical protein